MGYDDTSLNHPACGVTGEPASLYDLRNEMRKSGLLRDKNLS